MTKTTHNQGIIKSVDTEKGEIVVEIEQNKQAFTVDASKPDLLRKLEQLAEHGDGVTFIAKDGKITKLLD